MSKKSKKKRKNKKCLGDYLLKNDICIDFERPVIIDGKKTEYSVTRNGDVISYKFYNTDIPRVMKHCLDSHGYHCVHLNIDGEEKMVKVYRLVAEAFIPNPENKPQVNHKDGNKDHNYESNLEWSTEKENMEHAVRTGLKKGKKGSNHPMAKIDEKTAKEICELLIKNKFTNKEIAEKTNSTVSIVRKIKEKKRWLHISENYDFVNHKRKDDNNESNNNNSQTKTNT